MSLLKNLSVHEVSNDVLTGLLTREFISPSQEYRQPLISEEKPGTRTHLVVIWDAWRTLSQHERSSLIMDAYEKARGLQIALEVSSAMGLTQDEAYNLGFNFLRTNE